VFFWAAGAPNSRAAPAAHTLATPLGLDGNPLTDASKNACTLVAKSETQQRSVELKYIRFLRQRNKMIILRVEGSCFRYWSVR